MIPYRAPSFHKRVPRIVQGFRGLGFSGFKGFGARFEELLCRVP